MLQVAKAADELLQALKATDEYREYDRLRQLTAEDYSQSALLRRFLAAQTAVQMAALAGQPPRDEDASALEKLSSLVYDSEELSAYLLARMKVQRLVAETMQQITHAVGMDVELPEC